MQKQFFTMLSERVYSRPEPLASDAFSENRPTMWLRYSDAVKHGLCGGKWPLGQASGLLSLCSVEPLKTSSAYQLQLHGQRQASF